MLLGVGGLVLAGLTDEGVPEKSGYVPVCFVTGFIFIIWLFAAAIVQATSIRPAEITDREISLIGMSEDFVEAMREERRGYEDEGEDDRPRRRRPRDDEDDRPRAKRRDDDEGGYYDPRAKRRPRDRDDDER